MLLARRIRGDNNSDYLPLKDSPYDYIMLPAGRMNEEDWDGLKDKLEERERMIYASDEDEDEEM